VVYNLAAEMTLKIEPISGTNAELLVNDELHIPQDSNWLARFCEGFQEEFSAAPKRFSARANRTYYVVSNRGRREALIGIRFTNTVTANVSSIARLTQKSKSEQSVCEGWQYLDVLIENVLQPCGAKHALASLVTKGSLKAFLDLRRVAEQNPKGYRVEIYGERQPYPVAVVTLDTPGRVP